MQEVEISTQRLCRSIVLRNSAKVLRHIEIDGQADLSSFARLLEDLYLGEPAYYWLEFPVSYLQRIESLFDDIIFSHGIRPVQFEYRMLGKDIS